MTQCHLPDKLSMLSCYASCLYSLAPCSADPAKLQASQLAQGRTFQLRLIAVLHLAMASLTRLLAGHFLHHFLLYFLYVSHSLHSDMIVYHHTFVTWQLHTDADSDLVHVVFSQTHRICASAIAPAWIHVWLSWLQDGAIHESTLLKRTKQKKTVSCRKVGCLFCNERLWLQAQSCAYASFSTGKALP